MAAVLVATDDRADSLSRFNRCKSVQISEAFWYRSLHSFSNAFVIISSSFGGSSRKGRSVQNRVVNNGGSTARKRHPASRHLIEHSTKGKQIRTRIQFLGACLLW